MDLSIVTTLYNSAPYIEEFYSRMGNVAQKITSDYEIILVNDGSPDKSLAKARALAERDEHVTVIDLSRNFGHHKAMMTGLSYAQGEKVFLIDSDLEEDPELLETLNRAFEDDKDADVVYGVQVERKGGLFERLSGAIFYKVFNFLSSSPIPENLLTVRLMSSRFVKNLVDHKESELTIAGLWEITGFKQIPLPVVKHHKGATTYDLATKVSLLVNAVSSFSNKPLFYIFYIGLLIFMISACYIFALILAKVFFDISFPGYISLIVSVWFLGGITISALGIIGIYLSKIFIEVKRRPYTIVREVYTKGTTEEGDSDGDV